MWWWWWGEEIKTETVPPDVKDISQDSDDDDDDDNDDCDDCDDDDDDDDDDDWWWFDSKDLICVRDLTTLGKAINTNPDVKNISRDSTTDNQRLLPKILKNKK